MSKLDEIAFGPITNDEEYKAALKRAKGYFKNRDDDRCEVAMGRVLDYEEQHSIEEPEDRFHKCLRIAGRLLTIKDAHSPPPWKIVQLKPFEADSFLVGEGKCGVIVGAEIKALSGPAAKALAKMPEDIEWLLDQLLSSGQVPI